jgi:branched-subunit amino acid transport protein
MRELLTLVVIGLGTYAMRAAFLVMAHRTPPAPVARLLPYVGPAVLAAITVPAFVAPHGAIAFAETAPALLAAAAAWLAWRKLRHNLPIALFGGLAVWWIASWAVTAAVGLGLGPS